MASGSLVYVLAIALCALYTNETLLVAYSYRFHSDNPASSKLVFIAEVVKLLLATCFFLSEPGNAAWSLYQRLDDTSAALLPKSAKPQNSKGTHKAAAGYTELLQSDQVHRAVWDWVKAMAVFSVPAACYFVTNNLCIYALRIMPAHTYTLLSDLKIITTGVLSYLILDKDMNRSAGESLVLLFVGICLGQYGTTAGHKAAGSTAGAAAATATAYPLLHGTLIMVLIAVLSAVAAVYTEWVMNHSAAYKHESINLQNMRLYASGTLFNGIYCLTTAKGSLSTVADMRVAHWFIVLGLAFMGLVTAVIIKRFGNIVKIYSSCIASLFAAGASAFILHDPPAPLFYLGCVMAMTATLQLQRARNQGNINGTPPDHHHASFNGSAKGAAPAKHPVLTPHPGYVKQPGSPQAGKRVVRSALVPVVSGLVVVLLLASSATRPSNADPPGVKISSAQVAAAKAAAAATASKLGPTTDVPMMVQPPYSPTCFVDRDKTWLFGCPIIECSGSRSCTVDDPICCAYINYRMLTFFSRFLESKCLQGEYVLAHGTALGAVRNQTILPHDHDVDVSVTPLLLQFLELNSTREELWRHGYALFYYAEHKALWRLCPHIHHPDPNLRLLFKSFNDELTTDWEKRHGHYQDGFIDLWPMWQVTHNTTNCTGETGLDPKTQLAVPWDTPTHQHLQPPAGSSNGSGTTAGNGSHIETCSAEFAANRAQLLSLNEGLDAVRYCSIVLPIPYLIPRVPRQAKILNQTFSVPTNAEEIFVASYGEDWRTPSGSNGAWPDTPYGTELVSKHLAQKLSVTAWGNVPLDTRKEQCKPAA